MFTVTHKCGKAIGVEGRVWLCMTTIEYNEKKEMFYASGATEPQARKRATQLAVSSHTMLKWMMKCDKREERVSNCGTGTKCSGCRECDDGPCRKLTKQEVDELNSDLELYIAQRYV